MSQPKINFFHPLYMVLALLFFQSSIIVSAATSTMQNTVILPKVAWEENKCFIKELDLDTGIITKRFIQAKEIVGKEIQQVIDIDNQNVLLICRESSGMYNGYCLIYNLKTNQTSRLNVLATDANSIDVAKNDTSLVVNCNYYNLKIHSNEATTLVYDIDTLHLQLEWKNNYQKLIDLTNDYFYFIKDNDVVICSIDNGKEVKRIARDIDYNCFKLGQALGCDSDGTYRLTNFLAQKSKLFPLPNNKAGYGFLSNDSKWLTVLPGDSTSTNNALPKCSGELIVINTASGEQKTVTIAAEKFNPALIKSEESIFFRKNQVYLHGKNMLVSVNLSTRKTTSNPLVYASVTPPEKIGDPDTVKIKEAIANYERSIVNAINTGKFSFVKPYLTPESNLYNSQQKLVTNLFAKRTQEKLTSFRIRTITPVKNGVYQVNVLEKIAIKNARQQDFTIREFQSTYTVVVKNGRFTLSELKQI